MIRWRKTIKIVNLHLQKKRQWKRKKKKIHQNKKTKLNKKKKTVALLIHRNHLKQTQMKNKITKKKLKMIKKWNQVKVKISNNHSQK